MIPTDKSRYGSDCLPQCVLERDSDKAIDMADLIVASGIDRVRSAEHMTARPKTKV
ncbi:Hypothetical protein RG1141_PB00490 (plasmid) [Neorhizobium galegae bv. officinalis bv. officinalis str. HAMBI 1141]|uniref:Uncharacterized protein n=2 Tax=Neorhizobium galegae bv. officinalis TaxID=323656 RepID=A0A0T7G681_NEOGA|nr:Hypothetical protein RG1141_PB00490 [Neorhizobium galegae bv. officinalis bv. officinalis str. HAMBI 1141]CDZ30241.1 Hypothetical protein NGAL_HAMBI490_51090 [Neorhizobium galegae bv. officinalis]CDZ40671.1 Hypothetical protein NGAL_HAMBI1145_55110 [Neorhizobium galegae bv. officinalis]CDZ42666.1 Hypothetical protein NGAL_HAMBI1146_54330 [Neorhizobium galegae bv. officinalis]CDZ53581.1 Hypothetical protein NGAL_HAMBI1189_50660 [Neorhizobium galegae bv. officinalis]